MRAVPRLLLPSLWLLVTIAGGGDAHAAQAGMKPEPAKQVALTDQRIEAFLALRSEIDTILAEVQGGAAPDPKIMAELNAAARKYEFANYADYDDVAVSVLLVLAGIDPQTKKYVGAQAVTKAEIAFVQADKDAAPKDKKQRLEKLQAQLHAVGPVKIAANIPLVTKYYDRLLAAWPQGE